MLRATRKIFRLEYPKIFVVIFGEERKRERRRWSFVGGIVERGLTDETKECFDSGTVSFDGYTIIVPVRETWSFRDRISGGEHRYIHRRGLRLPCNWILGRIIRSLADFDFDSFDILLILEEVT